MPYIQLDGQQYPLVAGENAVGSGADVRIRLPGAGIESVAVVLAVGSDGNTVARRAGAQVVTVNGVALGAEPEPLLHGDRVEIGGRELHYGDDKKGGMTQYVPNMKLPQPGASSPAGAPKPTARTGGRLVSLVDGREYAIASDGLAIGRDPTCDIVVSSADVSRKHAVVAPSAEGYVLTDMSTNGVLVNGTRITAPAPLGKGDVITIGTDEFRFHADAAAAAAEAAQKVVLATLEVTSSGPMKGKKFDVRLPLTHLGRGAHNDVVIADESVSDSHAKLQKRESGWFVVDMGSTNGTYVGGKRIDGEKQLVGAPDVRLGGVKFIFRATDAAEAAGASSTRAIAALRPSETKGRATASARDTTLPDTPPRGVKAQRRSSGRQVVEQKSGMPVLVWIVAVLVLGALVLKFLTGR